MPLHIPHIFPRSRSRSHTPDPRTDLSTTYPLTPSQRHAQGYRDRSDWQSSIKILLDILDFAVSNPAAIDWREWSVWAECQNIRAYHFEDLDRVDQEQCASVLRDVRRLEDGIRRVGLDVGTGTGREGQIRPVLDVMELLERFQGQAEQLYGP